MEREKLIRVISLVIHNLEKSIKALVTNDKKKVSNNVWYAAADSEFALFLFYVMYKDQLEDSEKSHFHLKNLKNLKIGTNLIHVRDLLNQAKENIKVNNIIEAYQKVWIAREYLLSVQNKAN